MDELNQNVSGSENNIPSQPKLKKIKRLVKRPLPRPLSSEPVAPNGMKKIKRLVKRPLPRPLSADMPSMPQYPTQNIENPSIVGESDFLQNNDLNLPAFPLDDASGSNLQANPSLNSQPRFINDEDLKDTQGKQKLEGFMVGELFTKKAIIAVSVGCLFLGMILGKIFLSSSTVVQSGLSGVIANPEVPKGRARCGVAEKTQGCVLYLMNPQREDLNARDFYELASQLTGRQRFVIETGNMRYSNVKIAPGEIAQFNIPPLQ